MLVEPTRIGTVWLSNSDLSGSGHRHDGPPVLPAVPDGVTVGEDELATPIVPAGGNIIPAGSRDGGIVGDQKVAVIDGILMLVQEHKRLRGTRCLEIV